MLPEFFASSFSTGSFQLHSHSLRLLHTPRHLIEMLLHVPLSQETPSPCTFSCFSRDPLSPAPFISLSAICSILPIAVWVIPEQSVRNCKQSSKRGPYSWSKASFQISWLINVCVHLRMLLALYEQMLSLCQGSHTLSTTNPYSYLKFNSIWKQCWVCNTAQ